MRNMGRPCMKLVRTMSGSLLDVGGAEEGYLGGEVGGLTRGL
jgi:hypothetical protein